MKSECRRKGSQCVTSRTILTVGITGPYDVGLYGLGGNNL